MDINAVFDFIQPELFYIVVACWVVGVVLKKTPQVPDWTIVYLVTIAAVLFTGFTIGWGVQSVIQGILCGAAAVYGHQLYKQARKVNEK